MIEQPLGPAQERSPLEERVEIVARELELAIHWQRPCILFAVYSSEYVRADVDLMLENYLMDLGQETVHIRAKNEQFENLLQAMQAHKQYHNLVFFVDDLNWSHPDDTSVFLLLDSHRGFLNENCIRVVFWLTQNEIVTLSQHAPDFWTFRNCAVEFVEAPTAEQILVNELEAAWQGTGEYASQYGDTDDKIYLRESLLTAIPKHDETTSIRANMLLTLGILNWRKGDFEKADEQLQNALKSAIQIQDKWFEAECHNAVALLRSSMGRHEEAIDAYKTAIKLAPDQIFAWNNLGNLCVKIGRNDEALVTFIKALECNSQDPIAWNGLGNVYLKIGYVDDSITAYRKSIKFMPSFAQPWNGLGDAYARVNRTDEAIKAYQQAIQLNEHYVTPWLSLGHILSRQERHQEALRAFQRAAMLDQRNGAIWNEIGLVHTKQNALDEAIDAFSKAINIDRTNGWAYSNLGMAYAQQGKYLESISLFLRSLELLKEQKDKSITWNRLGDAYRQLDDYDEAIKAYEMADQTGHGPQVPVDQKSPKESIPFTPPQPSEPHFDFPSMTTVAQTPVAENKTEEPAEAAVCQNNEMELSADEENDAGPAWIVAPDREHGTFEPVTDNTTTSPTELGTGMQPMPTLAYKLQMAKECTDKLAEAMDWNEQGNTFFKQGGYEEAINAYNSSIQADPALGWPYSNLAQIYAMQNQYAEAILLYQKSIDLLETDREKAISWNGLGNVYRCLNDYDNAVAAYHKAAELDPATGGMRDGTGNGTGEQTPKNARAWSNLGDAFIRSGSYKEAVAAFKKAIEMDPQSGLAYNSLALALTHQGKYAEAIPLYKKGIALYPNNKEKANWLNRLGNAYRKLNDYDNAIKSFRDAIALSDEGADLVTRVRFSLLSNCHVE